MRSRCRIHELAEMGALCFETWPIVGAERGWVVVLCRGYLLQRTGGKAESILRGIVYFDTETH